MPHFDYKGKMMCHMAAFKQHAAMGFWFGAIMKDAVLLENAKSEVAMGHLGRITQMKDMPSDKKIISLDKGINGSLLTTELNFPPKKQQITKEIIAPDYFTNALK